MNLPNITSFHHFQVERGYLGVVYAKHYADSPEETFHIFKAMVHDGQLPEEITPPGLDPARQWYLYEHIRQFCGSRLAQDLTCPKPTVLKPGEQQHTTIPEQSSSSVRNRKRPPSEDESSAPAPKPYVVFFLCKRLII